MSNPATPPPRPSPAYAWWVVIVLMIAYIFSFIDRYIVNLLVEPMKRDLHLSDTKVSLLLGASFAMFYATLGLPLGRLADRHNRKNIITIGIVLWSLMTAACGLAKNYGQLFLARIGVGVGEASLSPSAYSIIADYFPKERLATALSIYSIGIYLGTGLAYIVGGRILEAVAPLGPVTLPLIGTIFSWQLVFFYVGLPGILIGGLVFLLREPVRRQLAGADLSMTTQPAFGESVRYLGKDRGLFWWFLAGSALFTVVSYGAGTWMPTYLTRIQHLTPKASSDFVGLISMLCAPVGLVLGGRIADYLSGRGVRGAKLRFCFWSAVVWIPISLAYNAMPTIGATKVMLVFFILVMSSNIGVSVAAIQEMVPAQLRSFASALLLFAQNAVGLGLGPTTPALLNDLVFHSDLALGKSLAITAGVALAGSAFCFYQAYQRLGSGQARLAKLEE
jgi:predicted MFS family arabinose efflux permease